MKCSIMVMGEARHVQSAKWKQTGPEEFCILRRKNSYHSPLHIACPAIAARPKTSEVSQWSVVRRSCSKTEIMPWIYLVKFNTFPRKGQILTAQAYKASGFGCLTLAKDKAQLEEDLTRPEVTKEHLAAAALGAEESRKAPENTPLNMKLPHQYSNVNY